MKRIKISVVTALLILLFSRPSLAINTCNDGWQISNGGTTTIDCQSTCKKVTNNTGASIFVPTKTSAEWSAFISNKPANVSLSDCLTLVAHWKLNDTSGASTPDDSGYGNNGTYSGVTRNVTGVLDKAYSFDGTNDYVDVPDSDSLDFGTGDFSIAFWARYTTQAGGTSDYASLISKNTGGTSEFSVFAATSDLAASNRLLFRLGGSSSTQVQSEAAMLDSTEFSLGAGTTFWKHYACIREGSTLKIYINGRLDNSASVSSVNVTNTSILRIGADSSSSTSKNFGGNLDDIRIYNGALSATQVYDLFKEAKTSYVKLILYATSSDLNGLIGGRYQADVLCYAARPGICSGTNIHAFMSVTSYDEIRDLHVNAFYRTDIPIYNPDRSIKHADDWADLLDGSLDNCLSDYPFRFWTGSYYYGMAVPSRVCSGWTSDSGSVYGYFGDNLSACNTDEKWLGHSNGNYYGACSSSANYRLLCICESTS